MPGDVKGAPITVVYSARALARKFDDVFAAAATPVEVGHSSRRKRAAMAFIGGLAAVGIYSMLSYKVARRQHEIGIRPALGAGCYDVLTLMLAMGGRLGCRSEWPWAWR